MISTRPVVLIGLMASGKSTVGRLLAAALASPVPAVIGAAAAAPLEPSAAAAMAGHEVVYLCATPDVLVERLARLGNGDEHRPFVTGDAGRVLRDQYADRDAQYRAPAQVVVDASVPAADAVDAITSVLAP